MASDYHRIRPTLEIILQDNPTIDESKYFGRKREFIHKKAKAKWTQPTCLTEWYRAYSVCGEAHIFCNEYESLKFYLSGLVGRDLRHDILDCYTSCYLDKTLDEAGNHLDAAYWRHAHIAVSEKVIAQWLDESELNPTDIPVKSVFIFKMDCGLGGYFSWFAGV